MENIDEVLLRAAHDREGVTWGWSKRCEPFVGTCTPADHLYFLHGSEDVKQGCCQTNEPKHQYSFEGHIL